MAISAKSVNLYQIQQFFPKLFRETSDKIRTEK